MKIGVDIGGTNLAAGLVDENGAIVKEVSTPTLREEGYEAVLGRIEELVKTLLDEASKEGITVDAVGLGVPGIVKDGLVVNAPNIFWKNETLKEDLEKRVGLPVSIINDATAAAVTEHRFGAAKGKKNAVMYTLGTGVGGGIIINDAVYSGSHGVASEFGHILSGDNFYTCNCGKNGCLETFASATALIKRHAYEVENGTESSLTPGDVDAKMIIEAAKEGDPASVRAYEILIEKLSESISNLVDSFDPEVFVIGGGIAQAGDFLFEPLREKAKSKLTFGEVVDLEILPAEFGNGAGIVGAAYSGEYV